MHGQVGVGIFFSSGVINRVAYKMTLVPMRPYIFFMAQLLSLVYMFFYLAILCMRCRSVCSSIWGVVDGMSNVQNGKSDARDAGRSEKTHLFSRSL